MLVTGRSRSIGLVLPRADMLAVDGFLPSLIHGLNEVCRERGYRLLMEAIRQPTSENAYSDLAKSKRVDSSASTCHSPQSLAPVTFLPNVHRLPRYRIFR